jgi:hypothetical protein
LEQLHRFEHGVSLPHLHPFLLLFLYPCHSPTFLFLFFLLSLLPHGQGVYLAPAQES